MKRSFKAVTVFAGAAALATGLAPAAHAGVTPGGPCATGEKQATRLVYSTNESHSADACYSGVGTANPLKDDPRFKSYCGGLWSGYFWIRNANGTATSRKHFTGGHVYHNLYNATISAISISRATRTSPSNYFCT